jgi:anti-sigma factor RsiW
MPADETTTNRELAELAALADGSLPTERRAAVERRVAASPRLQALLREQRAALDAVRSLDHRAPGHVRASIATTLAGPPARRRRGRVAAGALAAAAGVAALVLIALPGSEPAAPTLSQAAALADRQPALRALPSGDKAWGLAFPDLERLGGWKDAGARLDRVGSRAARTVYYVNTGRRIAYTILSAGSLRVPDGARSWRRKGKPWYAFDQGGRTVVAWERQGHMCVVSASGLSGGRLVRLITR